MRFSTDVREFSANTLAEKRMKSLKIHHNVFLSRANQFTSDLNQPKRLQALTEIYTGMSEKKGTFICEIVMERYIYLGISQKQLRITNYVRNKSFVEFYLV